MEASWFKREINFGPLSDCDTQFMFQDGPPIPPSVGKRVLVLLSSESNAAENYNLIVQWDGILTCGTWLTEMATELGHTNVRTVLPGIEPEFKPSNPEPKTIGVLAHPRAAKNTQFVIDTVREMNQGIHLIAYGKGNFDVNEMYERPSLEHMADIYRRCALWIMPSKSEGFSLCSLEAAACGSVPISLDYGVKYDFPIHMETGMVCEPSELASTIMQLIRDDGLRDKLRTNAINYAQSRPWSKVVDEVEQFLLQTIE
jgi:glycosyltransferase involved in cell wall biosynthesis